MIERESRLPLLIGGVVAVLLHTALVPVWGLGLVGRVDPAPSDVPEPDQPLIEPPELQAGQSQDNVTNIAWIAYEDYRELLARHSIVEQPALQNQVDPTPDAPIELDPTPPAPNTPTHENASSPGRESGGSASDTIPVSPTVPVPLPAPGEQGGDIPFVPDGPMTPDATTASENAPDASEQPAEGSEQAPADRPGTPDASARPTAAPRDEAESPPVTIMPGTLRIRPGRVQTYLGIEIKTAMLRVPWPARLSAVPRNPQAHLFFNNQGIVTYVDLTRSTGASNWDDPVITAFYKWKAKGEKIDNLEGEIRFTVELLLTSE